MKKKISIITINRNNLAGLQRTVESVVNQTWKEFEYLVIDGGSTDGSAEYIRSHNGNIDYWISEPDNGIYNAMNKGIAKATGEYLLFLNSGDHFFNDEVLLQNHKNLKLKDLIYFNLNVVGLHENYIKIYPDHLSFLYFTKDTLPHPATFIRRSLFYEVGVYDETYSIVSDWKFFLESKCKFECSSCRIDTTLSTFYLDGLSSDPRNREKIVKERLKVLDLGFTTNIGTENQFCKKKGEVYKSNKLKFATWLNRFRFLSKL